MGANIFLQCPILLESIIESLDTKDPERHMVSLEMVDILIMKWISNFHRFIIATSMNTEVTVYSHPCESEFLNEMADRIPISLVEGYGFIIKGLEEQLSFNSLHLQKIMQLISTILEHLSIILAPNNAGILNQQTNLHSEIVSMILVSLMINIYSFSDEESRYYWLFMFEICSRYKITVSILHKKSH